MDHAKVLAVDVGVVRACGVMNIDRSAVYRERAAARRLRAPWPLSPCTPTSSPLAFSEAERQRVLETLNSDRFAESSPRQTYATLLDEGVYLGSVRTMYRLLAGDDAVRERRNQLTHPAYAKPELLALRPNEVWSWDITKLRGPGKWTYRGGPRKLNTVISGSSGHRAGPQAWRNGALHGQENTARAFSDAESQSGVGGAARGQDPR